MSRLSHFSTAFKDLQYPLPAAGFQYPNGCQCQSLLTHSPDTLITGLTLFLAAFVVMVHEPQDTPTNKGRKGLDIVD